MSYSLELCNSIQQQDLELDAFWVRFNPEDQLIAVGCGDGRTRIYKPFQGSLLQTLDSGAEGPRRFPVTAVRWRPVGNSAKTKNILLTATCYGVINHWHATSGKILHTYYDPEAQFHCLDYSPNSSSFAVGGKDMTVKIFDEATKDISQVLQPGKHDTMGHQNRVYSVKYLPESENEVVSGGWDHMVLLWDLRTGTVVRSWLGPKVCGDTLDIKEDLLLAGSHMPKNQLSLYSLSMGTIMKEISFEEKPCCLPYAAQFSKWNEGEIMAVGGTQDMVSFYNTSSGEMFDQLTGLPQTVYGLDFSNNTNHVSIVCSDGSIQVYTMKMEGLTDRMPDSTRTYEDEEEFKEDEDF